MHPPSNTPLNPSWTPTELNFTVLRRYIPSITQSLSIAPFAVLYTFSPDTQAWEKCSVEGTVFICHYTSSPDDQAGGNGGFKVVNRKSLDNFEAELTSADGVEITPEYVILQTTGPDGGAVIYGTWIFEHGEAGVLGRGCALQAENARGGDIAGGGEGMVEDVGEEEEVEEGCGMDGTTEMQGQMEEEEAVELQAGWKLDLQQLFGSNHPPADVTTSPVPVSVTPPSAEVAQQPVRFAATADTGFSRSSRSPAVTQEQQTRAPPPQARNALLDLFKK
ncbi:hypothetical protein LTS10_011780 [Elasticomyces elasticus]|nr:hypothetical protein LTS10_011780 [Elasticomyces elasticus]